MFPLLPCQLLLFLVFILFLSLKLLQLDPRPHTLDPAAVSHLWLSNRLESFTTLMLDYIRPWSMLSIWLHICAFQKNSYFNWGVGFWLLKLQYIFIVEKHFICVNIKNIDSVFHDTFNYLPQELLVMVAVMSVERGPLVSWGGAPVCWRHKTVTHDLEASSVRIQEQDTSNSVCVWSSLQVQSGDPDVRHCPHQRPVPQNPRGQTPGEHTHKPTPVTSWHKPERCVPRPSFTSLTDPTCKTNTDL